jgi:uncharacterized protein YjdB
MHLSNRQVWLLAAAALLAACEIPMRRSSTGVDNPVTELVVTPDTLTLDLDLVQTFQFRAYGRLEGGDSVPVSVTWAASLGQVSPFGVYTADTTSPDAIVTATLDNSTLNASSRVRKRRVVDVVINPKTTALPVGGVRQFYSYGLKNTGDSVGIPVIYSATGGSISSGGAYTAGPTPGSYRVIAAKSGSSLADTATVTVSVVPVASVTVIPASATILTGNTQQLAAVTRDAAGNTLTGRVVTWSSSSTAVATVNAAGLLTANTVGSATITATSEGQSGTSAITVTSVPVAAVAVAPATANLQVGATVQLTATLTDAGGNVLTGRAVNWVTSNSGVATVSSSGLVSALAAGLATITATSEGKSSSAAVTVINVPVVSVTVSPTSASVLVGGTVQLVATPRGPGGNPLTGRVVTWTTSSSTVATVTGSGVVTGVAAGSATITATSEGINGTAAVTVTAPPPGALPAFPGAEGYGSTTRAGRGGQVIRVTNLNDAGPGSLRAALTATGPRTVIFDVSGQINLASKYIGVGSGFLTVAGQTAPAPGITINGGISMGANDVLLQHLRIRPGVDTLNNDAVQIDGQRIILDHVSVEWATDGNADIYGNDVTLRDCIVAQPTLPGGGGQGGGKNSLIFGRNVAILRTLYAHAYDRNPEATGGSQILWGNVLVYDHGEPGRWFGIWGNAHNIGAYQVSFIGSVCRKGLANGTCAPLFHSTTASGSAFYATDNDFTDGFTIQTSNVTQVGAPPFALPNPFTPLPRNTLQSYLAANAGARPFDRDPVDARIIADMVNGTGSQIISEAQVGGYPPLAQNTRALALPANPNGDDDGDGYTNLEELLHALAACVEGRSTNLTQCRAWAVIP